MRWNFRLHDWRYDAVHVILVAHDAILTGHAGGVARRAESLFHRAEIRREALRIALLVALQIGAIFFKAMAGQTTACLQDAEMRLMNETGEAPLPALERRRGEIDEPAFVRNIVDAVALRACPLRVLAREKIEDRRCRARITLACLGTG